MGRRGSKINIRHGVLQRFSRLSSSWPAFGPKPAFLTSSEKIYFFSLFLIYGLSGYIVFFWYWLSGKPVSIIQTKDEQVHENDNH